MRLGRQKAKQRGAQTTAIVVGAIIDLCIVKLAVGKIVNLKICCSAVLIIRILLLPALSEIPHRQEIVRITADHTNRGSTDGESVYKGGTANEQTTTPKIKVLKGCFLPKP